MTAVKAASDPEYREMLYRNIIISYLIGRNRRQCRRFFFGRCLAEGVKWIFVKEVKEEDF